MITLSGTLTVRPINGRYGKFNIGSLQTNVGKFSIKDRLIEELSEGKYTGEFIIALIKTEMYMASGRVIVDIRAWLNDMQLFDDKALSEEEKIVETIRDPIEEEGVEQSQADTMGPEPAGLPITNDGGAKADNATPDNSAASLTLLKEVFGDTFIDSNGEPKRLSTVELDPTIPRAMLRKQAAVLNDMGFINNFREGKWELKKEEMFDNYIAA